jgi:SAM-dependent methyltransferase
LPRAFRFTTRFTQSPSMPPPRRRLSARTSDKHELYQKAVQTPEADAAFVERVYRKLHGRVPEVLREDFCGTGFFSAAWVARRKTNRAYGVDIDPEPLAWGELRNRAPLGAAAERMRLVRADVRSARIPRCEVAVALNFSYNCLVSKSDLLGYFRAARRGLREGGIFVLDAFGGPEAMIELEESTRKEGFTYVWEQEDFDPISQSLRAHITFRFPDGTQRRRAFSYDWRLWTLPELRECLELAGFARVRFFFETIGRNHRGTGVFRETLRSEACESFVCCIVAER